MEDDPRIQRTRLMALEAAGALYLGGDLDDVTLSNVAKASGLARSTIYRHWPTRDALLADLASHFDHYRPVTTTGDLHGDLTRLLDQVRDRYENAPFAQWFMRVAAAAANGDPGSALRLEELAVRRVRHLQELVHAEWPDFDLTPTDAHALAALLFGPLLHQSLISQRRIDDDLMAESVDRAVDYLVNTLRPVDVPR